MTPAGAPRCEVCGLEVPAPVLGTLPFSRGRNRRVCVDCLATAIQSVTGFKVVAVVRRMLQARAEAPAMAAAAREARRAFYAEAEAAASE